MRYAFLGFYLFLTVNPVYAESTSANDSITTFSTKNTWQDWAQKYPDSVDYDGMPLKMLFEAEWPGDYEGKIEALKSIKKAYPKSKIAPYLDYVLIYNSSQPALPLKEKRSRLLALIKNYKDRTFPSICEQFVTEDKPLPTPGLKVAALAQVRLAETYYTYHLFNKDTIDNAVLQKAADEWNKVLGYFPDRFNFEKGSIANTEWSKLIYPAYFTIAQINSRLNNTDKVNEIADQIVKKGPDIEYGDFYTKDAYAEAYLIKAVRSSESKDYQMAEGYLQKVVNQYYDKRWYYHHGVGEQYYATAAKKAKELLLKPKALEFIENLTSNELYQKNTSTMSWISASLLKTGLLYDLNKQEDAKKVLKDIFKQHPKEMQGLAYVDPNWTLLGDYFPRSGSTPLKTYYEELLKEYLQERSATK